MTAENGFKTCPMCQKCWPDLESFLADPQLLFNGYQANFEFIDNGLFYFTHDREHCGSTMILEAPRFYGLYQGKRYTGSKRGKEDCPGHCSDRLKLERCGVRCEYAFLREISQFLLDTNRKVRGSVEPGQK